MLAIDVTWVVLHEQSRVSSGILDSEIAGSGYRRRCVCIRQGYFLYALPLGFCSDFLKTVSEISENSSDVENTVLRDIIEGLQGGWMSVVVFLFKGLHKGCCRGILR